ncbi:FepA family TonB-dependent siderophore receptor [Acinetobacter sp. ME22]|uniref:FepA family TonB-dependent siderophore receptor n=1 Tax=Acinetobacter sp. ME22 TaxID=2904802 RepID=UPI001EDB4731|nr:FepA family TonB-dependent siderophore receptor [Acinetobacter sp. ME22]MCG2572616.1 FepA family TonB-dependent siderophore receptor [Acinetobacter sp. ME22]
MSKRIMQSLLSISVLTVMATMAQAADSTDQEDNTKSSTQSDVVQMQKIVVTAEQQVKQSLGASVVTAEDIEKNPVRNDISEILARQPGINLTGNSANGVRGNNRQVDIRGMGPENTLILIDGRPVNSRQSVRYGRTGDRDTRGDTNWVPAEDIDHIEVLRGPAAARYGNGAMGGVINIITKKASNKTHGSLEYYTNQPENSKEGASNRVGFNLSGPIINDVLSYRLYGNWNKTDADSADLNSAIGSTAAPREGVRNKDVSGQLLWKLNDQQSLTLDASVSRQGNIYAGDTQYNYDTTSGTNTKTTYASPLIGQETNTMYRQSFALTHNADWDWGKSKFVVQYDDTKNKRYIEGLTGGVEGTINSTDKSTNNLRTFRLNGEVNIPFEFYVPHVLTAGVEYVDDHFVDPSSMTVGASDGSTYAAQLTTGDRTKMSSDIKSTYLEDNISLTSSTDAAVSLRFDDHSSSGTSWSPGLNLTQKLGDYVTLKGGIAKAYKTPNLYQNAEGYLLLSRGNGCPAGSSYTYCLIQGNADLKPETSVNKEFGIQFKKDIVNASLTWFRNDYKNKIEVGTDLQDTVTSNGTTYYVFKWENIPKALVQGLEGSLGFDWGNIRWTNNFTYYHDNVNKETGNPLSVIPIYTINSILGYDITDKLDMNVVYTQYGRQKPRQYAVTKADVTDLDNLTSLKSYSIAGINFGYKFNKNLSGRIGVSNLFDKVIYRDSNSNSQTYNEPGRAYYASIKYSF